MVMFRRARQCLPMASLVASLGVSTPAAGEEPTIDHQPVICSIPGRNARICAQVLDDGEVKRVRTYFRAYRPDKKKGDSAFYFTAMAFDGIQYCATLPIAKKDRDLQYYIWAVDDQFDSTRTRNFDVSLAPEQSCAYPVVDDDPERTRNLTVNATSPDQGSKIKEFESSGIKSFVPVKKR